MEPHTIEFVGAPCGQHGPYTFYKAFKFSFKGKYRILSLGEFFFVKISEDAPVCIGELQLLWEDKNNESVHMSSLRLYFLPEHTPEGRQEYHGQDEILAENDKIVMRVADLGQWIIDDLEWPIGSKAVCDADIKADKEHEDLIKLFNTNNYGLQFKDIKKEKQLIEGETPRHCSVTILSYSRYCRYKAISKRLEDVSNSWLKNALVSAIGGFTTPAPGTRIVFCRDTFEHPNLANHDYRQDHLAPNLKGRPRKKRLKMRRDMESDSNDSDFTPGREEKALRVKDEEKAKMRRKVMRAQKDKVSAEEESFLSNLIRFMKDRKTPIDRIPSLGFKQIDLYYFYSYAQKLGGYEQITQRRMWKHLYDKLGGNPGSTSAATCTRRHYERLLLAFERFQKGEKDTGPMQLPDDYDERCENKSDDPDIITIPDNDDDVIPQIAQKNNVFKGLQGDDLDALIYTNDKPCINHINANAQKNVLSEQSSNHFAQKAQELSGRRFEAKENGSSSQPGLDGHHHGRPMQNIALMQKEPNAVMVVSKNGEMVRSNRGAPSIMTPLKKPNTQQMLTPQGLPLGFVHQSHHHPHHHHLHHHKQMVHNQTVVHNNQHRSQFPNQTSAHQHKQYLYPSRPVHQNLHQRSNTHPHHVSANKVSASGTNTNNNGPIHVVSGGGSQQLQRSTPRQIAQPSPHLVHDPRRPSVIQHTQVKGELCSPPPAHHNKAYGGSHHHMRHGALTQPPPAGIKRPYPSLPPQSLPTHPNHLPPTAHNSKTSPSIYIRDLDPYANSVKRPHLQNARDPVFPASATATSLPPGLNKPTPSNLDPKLADEMPTDLSMKRSHIATPAPVSALNFSTNANSQAQHGVADDAPLNLVTHRRAPEASPTLTQPPGGKPVEKRPLILNHSSPMALPYENHSKVPKDSSASSSLSRVSSRTLGPENTLMSHRPLSRASPQISAPRPSSHPSPNFTQRVTPRSQQARAPSPAGVYWNSPQGATPVSASPDMGAASIHPAFPSSSLHLMPGLLRPEIFYEAQLQATQSPHHLHLPPRQPTEAHTPPGSLSIPAKPTLTEQRK